MKISHWFCWSAFVFFVPGGSAAELEISISDGYVRGLPPGVQSTAAYMTIENNGVRALTLTGARSSVADQVSLHETRMSNGQMSMVPVPVIVIPAAGELILESGGRHFMLMGLNGLLTENEDVDLTLLFEGEQEFQISLPVRSVLSETSHTGH